MIPEKITKTVSYPWFAQTRNIIALLIVCFVILTAAAYLLQMAATSLLLFFTIAFFLLYIRASTIAGITANSLRFEKELLEGETRFKELFDNMTSGVAIYEAIDCGNDFIILDMNRAARRMTRVYEGFSGQSVRAVFPGVEIFGLFAVFQQVWKTGVAASHPVQQYQDHKLAFWAENYVYKLPSGQIVAIFDNVTEKKLAEEKALASYRQWQKTFDASNSAIWILDAEQRILQSNKTAEKFFNRPTSAIIGQYCWEVVHGTSEPIFGCPAQRMQETLQRETMDLQVGDAWYEVIVDPLMDEKGRFSGAIHIVSDITQRKQAEIEKNRFNKELEQHVALRTAELSAQTVELERLNRVFIDREIRMRELKQRIAELEKNVCRI